MARYSIDRGSRFISIGVALAAGTKDVNTGTTPANNGAAATTGPGDEVGIPPFIFGDDIPHVIAWDVRTRGGAGNTFSARVVNLEGSLTGLSTDWDIIDSISDPVGGSKNVPVSSYRYLRANIPNAPTVSAGAPTSEVGITV